MGRVARAALIVDLDGTVWDSRSWYDSLVALRRPGSAASANAAKALRQAGWTESLFKSMCQSREPPLKCFSGVREALGELANRGVGLGAVTNLPRWMALPMIASVELEKVLAHVVTWGDTARHKPYPDPLCLAADRLGVPAAESWYVGDEPSDQLAAAAAGMNFAFAGWGCSEEFLRGRTRVLRSAAEFVALAGARR